MNETRNALVFIVSICWRKMAVKEATEILNSKCYTRSSTLDPSHIRKRPVEHTHAMMP